MNVRFNRQQPKGQRQRALQILLPFQYQFIVRHIELLPELQSDFLEAGHLPEA